MNEEQLGEKYQKLLDDTFDALDVVKELMESEDDSFRVFAVDAYIQLCDRAINLLDILCMPSEDLGNERNPLARRAKLGRKEAGLEV